jgi:phenylacetate-CoA ligase
MTEAATIFMFECSDEPGGCHIIEPDFIEEVIEPESMQPAGYGERGVRVMTSLGREGIQMFRYWTNDLVVRRRYDECPCGRTWDWYEGGIQGRHDDMRKVRGVWFMPIMIEDVVRAFPDVDEFQCVLATIDELDTLVLKIEPRAGYPPDEAQRLAEAIRTEVKRQISLNPLVEVAPAGSLPRFEMKARRFQDGRPGASAS